MRVEVFEINVPAQDSPWDLDFGWEHHHTPFRSRVSILKSTGEMVRVERVALGIPRSSGVAEIRWAVELANAKVGGNTYLVRTEGEYLVRYVGLERYDRNVLSFRNYRESVPDVASRLQ